MNIRSAALRVQRIAAMAACTALLPLALSAAPAAAANSTHLLAGLGNCGFSGTNAVHKASIKIEWKDSDGRLKGKQAVKSNASGAFSSLCERDELIEPGDTIKTTEPSGSKTVTVPALSLSVDRALDTVSGLAPNLATLVVEVDTYNGGFGTPSVHLIDTAADGAGAWNADFSSTSVDIRGWDDVYVGDTTGGNTFFRYIQAQAVEVLIGQPWVYVAGDPGDNVDLHLANGGPRGSFSGNLDYYGSMENEFIDASHAVVRPHVGDAVTSTAYLDIALVIPNVIASVNATTQKVTGNCGTAVATGYVVRVHSRDYSKVADRFGTTSGSGAYTAKFKTGTPTWTFKSGDKVTIACKLATGDIVSRIYTLP